MLSQYGRVDGVEDSTTLSDAVDTKTTGLTGRCPRRYWNWVVQMNEYQKSRFSLNMVRSMFNTVTGKKIAIFCVEINQCVGCTRQFFTKSFLGDDVAVLARSSG